MADRIKAVVLAAGRSTRMKSEISKVLHPILGREIIRYLLDSLLRVRPGAEEDIVVVVGDNRAEIEKAIGSRFHYARQQEQLGTAHALLSAAEQVAAHAGGLLVLVGDNPYITAAELRKLIARHQRSGAACTFISAVFPEAIPPLRPRRPRRAGEGRSASWRKRTPAPSRGASARSTPRSTFSTTGSFFPSWPGSATTMPRRNTI